MLLENKEAFYGGAVGGGKSDALLMAALQYVDIPGYAALLLRDSFANLTMPGALLDRADEWLEDSDAVWDGNAKTYRFPSGATVTFGYLQNPRDHLNYKSAEFQFIGFDETTDLRWRHIMYLHSRLRRLKGANVPLRFRLASNPGGESHEEIKYRYVNPKTRKKGVAFIPAGISDNPYLDSEEYMDSLMNLDPITRAQLIKGDWDVQEKGRMFDRSWFNYVDAPPRQEDIISTIRYWDLAGTEPKKKNMDPDWTVGVKMSLTKSNQYYIESVVRLRKEPHGVEATVRQTADMDGKKVLICMEQEPGSSGKNTISHYRRNILPEFVFTGDRPTGSKIERAAPFSSQAEAGNVFIVRAHWNEKYIDELELFPDGKYKDQVDGTSGAFGKLAKNIHGSIRVRSVKRRNR